MSLFLQLQGITPFYNQSSHFFRYRHDLVDTDAALVPTRAGIAAYRAIYLEAIKLVFPESGFKQCLWRDINFLFALFA